MRVSIRVRVTGAPNNSFKRRPLRVYEIGAFLKVRIGLNVIAIYRWRPRLTPPFGTRGNVIHIPFLDVLRQSRILNARCATSVVQKPVVPGVVRTPVVLEARGAACGTEARGAICSLCGT